MEQILGDLLSYETCPINGAVESLHYVFGAAPKFGIGDFEVPTSFDGSDGEIS